MLASVLQAASPSALQARCSGHDRRTREARRHLQRDWNAPTHKHGADSRAAAACQRHNPPIIGILQETPAAARLNMIKGVIIVNNLGVVRLAKFYEQVHVTGESAEQAQQSVIKKIYRAVSKRQDNQCNYLEGSIPEWGGDTKLIYRHYATLYFVFACTNRESDLGILDLIQVFVEALDRSFENVCELDLIFHSDKCHYVLDEIIIGGLVLDTSITNIMGGADDQNKLHKSSLSLLTSSGPKKTQIGARLCGNQNFTARSC